MSPMLSLVFKQSIISWSVQPLNRMEFMFGMDICHLPSHLKPRLYPRQIMVCYAAIQRSTIVMDGSGFPADTSGLLRGRSVEKADNLENGKDSCSESLMVTSFPYFYGPLILETNLSLSPPSRSILLIDLVIKGVTSFEGTFTIVLSNWNLR